MTAFLVDPAVTDVLVNGVDVWIDRGTGRKLLPDYQPDAILNTLDQVVPDSTRATRTSMPGCRTERGCTPYCRR